MTRCEKCGCRAMYPFGVIVRTASNVEVRTSKYQNFRRRTEGCRDANCKCHPWQPS